MRNSVVLAVLIVVGLSVVSGIPGTLRTASAAIAGPSALFEFAPQYGFIFYVFNWTGSDCITSRLYFNNVLQTSSSDGCGPSGTFVGSLNANPGMGTYRFQLWSTTFNTSEYSKQWTTPGLEMSVSVSTSSASVGETVGIDATLTLAPTAPDYLSDTGYLNVSGPSLLTQDAAFAIADPAWVVSSGVPWNALYGEATYLVPMSYATAGTKPIAVDFTDPFVRLSSSVSLNVADPVAAQIATITGELAGIQANLTTATGDVASLQTQLATLEGEIAALRSTTSSNDTTAQVSLANLQAELSRLWSQVNASSTSGASASAASTTPLLSDAALVFGVAGIAIGAIGVWTTRRLRREIAGRPPRPGNP